ncbi:hypothetical protein [Rothia nasimurium]|uniref:hypothetical protein n=1 Tax=Rothia nasimurium TaxID=85336 RepID=UPI002DD64C02|nr:hypothetical protein [Rothia nasimurium]
MGLELITPTKPKPGQRMAVEVNKKNNRVINRLQSVDGRIITQTKTCQVLNTEFQATVEWIFSVMRGLVFYAVGRDFE